MIDNSDKDAETERSISSSIPPLLADDGLDGDETGSALLGLGTSTMYRYRDFSHVTEEEVDHLSGGASADAAAPGGPVPAPSTVASARGSSESSSIRVQKFPVKLYAILAQKEFHDIITWMPHGRAWKVLKPSVFESLVMPLFFEYSNYHSFNRLVNAWSFRRISNGPDRGAYYHELFLRGKPHLQKYMRRLPKTHKKMPMKKGDEPDFYSLDKTNPLPPLESAPIPGAAATNALMRQAHNSVAHNKMPSQQVMANSHHGMDDSTGHHILPPSHTHHHPSGLHMNTGSIGSNSGNGGHIPYHHHGAGHPALVTPPHQPSGGSMAMPHSRGHGGVGSLGNSPIRPVARYNPHLYLPDTPGMGGARDIDDFGMDGPANMMPPHLSPMAHHHHSHHISGGYPSHPTSAHGHSSHLMSGGSRGLSRSALTSHGGNSTAAAFGHFGPSSPPSPGAMQMRPLDMGGADDFGYGSPSSLYQQQQSHQGGLRGHGMQQQHLSQQSHQF